MTDKDKELHHQVFDSMFMLELCNLVKIESKSKIQQMAIDCLALVMDISPCKDKTEQLLMKCFGVPSENVTSSPNYPFVCQVKERMNKDYLPMLQIDGTIEFKP